MVKKILLVMVITLSFIVEAGLVDTIKKVKPSVVGVGVYTPMGSPKNQLMGTGFVIGDGYYVVTNFHVIPEDLDPELMQKVVVFSGSGKKPKIHKAEVIFGSQKYDLALLKIPTKLPALQLGDSAFAEEGLNIAFTGFPMGAVLGLHPVTHHGIISAITPTTSPVPDSRQITLQMLKRMRTPYLVYQLDATAYPGNSGSAFYDADTGVVLGIINKVFVQKTKEAVISNPSGITYAIPVKYLHEELAKHNIVFKK